MRFSCLKAAGQFSIFRDALRSRAGLDSQRAGEVAQRIVDYREKSSNGLIRNLSEVKNLSGVDLARGNFAFIRALYNMLVRLDKDLNPQPELATSWQISPDGMHIKSPGHPVHVWSMHRVPLQQASPLAQDPFAATHQLGTTDAPYGIESRSQAVAR